MSLSIIISTGIGRLHLVQSAIWLSRNGLDVTLIQGWVPALSERSLSWVGHRIGHPRLAYGMRQRCPAELYGRIRSCASAEFLHQFLIRLARIGIGDYWKSARLTWRYFGWLSSAHLKNASVFHVRSGAGQGGAIRAAKSMGMHVVVDRKSVV